MQTVADLKRAIHSGVKLKLVNAMMSGAKEPHKYIGVVRTVTKVQTNGFYCATDEQLAEGKKGSFCNMPKATQFKGQEDGFTITDDCGMRSYQIVEAL